MDDGCTYAFGDNHAIIQPSNIPKSNLMKCWNALAFHCIQEAIVMGFLQLFYIPGNEDPANLLIEFLGYQEAIPYLCPLLFWHGDMSDIPMKGSVN